MRNLLILIPQLLKDSSKTKQIEDLEFSDFVIGTNEFYKASHVVYQQGDILFLMKSSIIPKKSFITQWDLQALTQGKVPVNAYQELIHEGKKDLDQAVKELRELGIDLFSEFKQIANEHLSKWEEQNANRKEKYYRISNTTIFLFHEAYHGVERLKYVLLTAYMERQSLPFDSLTETFAKQYLKLLNKHKPEVAIAS